MTLLFDLAANPDESDDRLAAGEGEETKAVLVEHVPDTKLAGDRIDVDEQASERLEDLRCM